MMAGLILFMIFIGVVFFFLWERSDKFKAMVIAAGGALALVWDKIAGFIGLS